MVHWLCLVCDRKKRFAGEGQMLTWTPCLNPHLQSPWTWKGMQKGCYYPSVFKMGNIIISHDIEIFHLNFKLCEICHCGFYDNNDLTIDLIQMYLIFEQIEMYCYGIIMLLIFIITTSLMTVAYNTSSNNQQPAFLCMGWSTLWADHTHLHINFI